MTKFSQKLKTLEHILADLHVDSFNDCVVMPAPGQRQILTRFFAVLFDALIEDGVQELPIILGVEGAFERQSGRLATLHEIHRIPHHRDLTPTPPPY